MHTSMVHSVSECYDFMSIGSCFTSDALTLQITLQNPRTWRCQRLKEHNSNKYTIVGLWIQEGSSGNRRLSPNSKLPRWDRKLFKQNSSPRRNPRILLLQTLKNLQTSAAKSFNSWFPRTEEWSSLCESQYWDEGNVIGSSTTKYQIPQPPKP